MNASESMTNDRPRPRFSRHRRTELDEAFVLVVMENAAPWPAHLNGGVGACVALRQEPQETRGELLRRTYERIRAIERIGGTIERAVLSCNDDVALAALAGRAPLARALLGTVLHESRGRLELLARDGVHEQVKRSLIALAGTLTEALVGTSASVSARFAEAHRPRPPAHAERAAHRETA